MRDGAVGIAVQVGNRVVSLFVEGPVFVEVATGTQRPEPEDGLGTGEGPACTGDVHAVLDEVAAGALDDASGDGEAGGQILVILEMVLEAEQVVGTAIDGTCSP